MKIIVDAFGGDNAPLEIIKGCAEAVKELDIDIMLIGREQEIRKIAREHEIVLDRMEIVDAPDVITTVSYTHLDVYKRQVQTNMRRSMPGNCHRMASRLMPRQPEAFLMQQRLLWCFHCCG